MLGCTSFVGASDRLLSNYTASSSTCLEEWCPRAVHRSPLFQRKELRGLSNSHPVRVAAASSFFFSQQEDLWCSSSSSARNALPIPSLATTSVELYPLGPRLDTCTAAAASRTGGQEIAAGLSLSKPLLQQRSRPAGRVDSLHRNSSSSSSSSAASAPLDRPQGRQRGLDGAEETGLVQGELVAALGEGAVERAVGLFWQLEERGVAPAPAVSDRLVQMLCERRRFTAAWTAYCSVHSRGYALRYATYQALITAAIQAGEAFSAVEVVGHIQEAGMRANPVTCCAVISALGKVRQRGTGRRAAQTAYALWHELAASGLPLDAAAYRTGINACVRVNEMEEAREVLAAMKAAGIVPDARAYNILVKGLSRAGEVGAVPGVLAEMQRCGVRPTSVTFNTIIDAYVRANCLAEAHASLQAAREAGVKLDAYSYSCLMRGHIEAGQPQEALRLLQRMRDDRLAPNEVVYTVLIDGCSSVGQVEAARGLLAQMWAAGVRPNALTYNSLIKGYAQQGAPLPRPLEVCLQLLKEMGDVGVVATTDTYNALMEVCVSHDDSPAALRLYQRMKAIGFVPDTITYTTLIKACSRMGRVDDAVRAFQEMDGRPDTPPDAAALNAFVDALARAGRMDAAQSLLPRILHHAERIGVAPPVQAYGALIQGWARLRQVEPALALLRQFYQAGGAPDAQMFDTLVDLCMRTGEFYRAMQVVHAMEKCGEVADKAKYKRLFRELSVRRDRWQEDSRRRRRRSAAANQELERFKFWLGLPNSYYTSDWQPGDPEE